MRSRECSSAVTEEETLGSLSWYLKKVIQNWPGLLAP